MNPLINILIRSHRPDMLKNCLASVSEQTYENKLLWLDENGGAMPEFTYNNLCNKLKALISDGWFFFLDDDDTLFQPEALARISLHLDDTETAVICQFIRDGWKKPSDDMIQAKAIVPGQIGMPCLFLHSSKKDIADIRPTEDGDFLWIKEVASKMAVKFVPLIVVNSPKRNFGK